MLEYLILTPLNLLSIKVRLTIIMILSDLFEKKLTGPALIIATGTFLSAVLGLLRDKLLAFRFGVGSELAVYAAAFRIPDLVYVFLVSGGLALVFLPIFSEIFSRDETEAWEKTNYIFNAFSVFLVCLSVLLFIFSPLLIKVLLPGFSPEMKRSALGLTRLLFLSPIFLGMSNIFSGVLQYFNKFIVFAIAPVVYNLSIILGILLLSPKLGIFGVGLGVVLGAILYFLSQFLGAKQCGFHWQPFLNFKDKVINRTISLMIPRTAALLLQQLNLWAITIVASFIGGSALAIFYYANNLQGFFTNFIGVSLATAAFPLLSRAVAQKDKQEFWRYFNQSFKQILLISLAAMVFILIFGRLMVSVLLGGGRFDMASVEITLKLVFLFSLSLFAQAGNVLLIRAFFSFQEAKIPILAALGSFVVNVMALLAFWRSGWGAMGLAASYSLSVTCQFFLLWLLLNKKLKAEF